MSSRQRTLADLCTVKQGKYLGPSEMSAVKTAEMAVPVVGGNGVLGYTDRASHSVDVPLVTCRGSQCGLIQWVQSPVWVSNNAMACDTGSLGRNRFLRYLLSSAGFDDVITGSAQPQITVGHLTKKVFDVCPEDQWDGIVGVLASLDDRITLLRETNATLEAIAQALFKSWFVEFDPVRAKRDGRAPEGMDEATAALFPDSFEDSELGQLPTGWSIGVVLDVANLLSGGTPKTDRAEFWGGNILWASAKDVSQSSEPVLLSTERSITQAGVDGSATRIIPAMATVVVARGATTGRSVMFGTPMAMNQTCYALTSKLNAPVALNCLFRRQVATLLNAAHGSVFDTITTATFAQARCVLPPARLVQEFESVARPLFDRVITGVQAIQTLTALRDTLLPRLISGQLRLPEATEPALA